MEFSFHHYTGEISPVSVIRALYVPLAAASVQHFPVEIVVKSLWVTVNHCNNP